MSNGRIKSVSPSVGRAPQEEPWVPDAGSNTALMMSGPPHSGRLTRHGESTDMAIPERNDLLSLGEPRFSRLPRHVGMIPDGNRRWARERGLPVAEGYNIGVCKGLQILQDSCDLGIEEVSVYGFTQDNTKRPKEQRIAFTRACVAFVEGALDLGVALLVVGNSASPMFPDELKPFAKERHGQGLKVNMLVNYGWEWDLQTALEAGKKRTLDGVASCQVSRIDMIIRRGGCRRLSGFLPIQSVYADFYVVNDYWPDYEYNQFLEALAWYQTQDPTLGG